MVDTVGAVIDAIGGNKAAADLADVVVSAVSNWKADGRIPAEYWPVFSKAAGRKLPLNLFSFKREQAS